MRFVDTFYHYLLSNSVSIFDERKGINYVTMGSRALRLSVENGQSYRRRNKRYCFVSKPVHKHLIATN